MAHFSIQTGRSVVLLAAADSAGAALIALVAAPTTSHSAASSSASSCATSPQLHLHSAGGTPDNETTCAANCSDWTAGRRLPPAEGHSLAANPLGLRSTVGIERERATSNSLAAAMFSSPTPAGRMEHSRAPFGLLPAGLSWPRRARWRRVATSQSRGSSSSCRAKLGGARDKQLAGLHNNKSPRELAQPEVDPQVRPRTVRRVGQPLDDDELARVRSLGKIRSRPH